MVGLLVSRVALSNLSKSETSKLGLNSLGVAADGRGGQLQAQRPTALQPDSQGGHLLGNLDVGLLLDVSDSEDDINLLEGTASGLGVLGRAETRLASVRGKGKVPVTYEDVDNGNEGQVEDSEDEESGPLC